MMAGRGRIDPGLLTGLLPEDEKMKITVLIENTVGTDLGLTGEHGLSLLIQRGEERCLLDAGSSGAFLENAGKLGIVLDGQETCVLSHGHYDHAGGFAAYLALHPGAAVYAMKDAWKEYYSDSGGRIHKIGIPEEVFRYRSSFRLIDKVTQIGKGIWLIPHSAPRLEEIGKRAGLYRMEDGKLVPDRFAHEMSLVYETEQGLVIFNSCSHAGIGTIMDEVESILPGQGFYAFIGGLHMKAKENDREVCRYSEGEVRDMAEDLKRRGLRCLYTGHCTGNEGFRLLRQYLGEGLQELRTGKTIVL